MRYGNDTTSSNTAKPKRTHRMVSPMPDPLERLKNANVLRRYVLTLPVCHKGSASGLQCIVECRRRVGETAFEFFALSFVEMKYVAEQAVVTHRPLHFNYVFSRELRVWVLESVRSLFSRVKSDAARGLLLVTLYGCTGGRTTESRLGYWSIHGDTRFSSKMCKELIINLFNELNRRDGKVAVLPSETLAAA